MANSDAERIKRLRALCDQVDALRQQAEKICQLATMEIQEWNRRSLRERRSKRKTVKRERRD